MSATEEMYEYEKEINKLKQEIEMLRACNEALVASENSMRVYSNELRAAIKNVTDSYSLEELLDFSHRTKGMPAGEFSCGDITEMAKALRILNDNP